MSKFLAEVLVLEVAVKLNRPSYLWADCVIPSFALFGLLSVTRSTKLNIYRSHDLIRNRLSWLTPVFKALLCDISMNFQASRSLNRVKQIRKYIEVKQRVSSHRTGTVIEQEVLNTVVFGAPRWAVVNHNVNPNLVGKFT